MQREYAEKSNEEYATNIKTIEGYIKELLNSAEPKIQKNERKRNRVFIQ